MSVQVQRGIQYGYSKRFARYMYDEPSRRNKALRVLQMFRDHRPDLSDCNTLEVGSATGIMTFYLAEVFQEVVGIDIDREAMAYARQHYQKPNIQYLDMDGLNMDFADETFDTVVCHHTYEHVADSGQLLREIRRVLRPNGLLYFGAPNRLMIKESHYDMYFLSWLPPVLAGKVLQWTGQGEDYYERMLTYGGIRRLLSGFAEVQDYTLSCIVQAERYHSEDVVADYPWLRGLPKNVIRLLLPFAPDYVFLAKK